MLTVNITEEENSLAVELTLFQLQVQLVFPELLEDMHHVLAMSIQILGVDQDVVDADDDEVMEELPEHLIPESLKYRR